ncbi:MULTISPECIES: hypothetical protein [Olivibacter]|uniref:hypothetical protein n=1 Tax=Olivibacter TaxID=376469 RepID=UPI001030BDF4|nr:MULTISPECIES: hypothetical protein [Olivibacter]MDX3916346.1 hypothetical protein [Pseudosphingobacterium sp.]QEK99445.1 hypothetical protein FKG96_01085 [Olivibacter sp. LS-1]
MENFIIIYRKYLLTTLLIASILAYIAYQPLIRLVDVTAAPIDYGVLSAILVAAVAVLSFVQLCLWVLHRHWPFLGEYAAEHFERNFKSLLSWQKVGVYLGFFLALLYAFVIALGALL